LKRQNWGGGNARSTHTHTKERIKLKGKIANTAYRGGRIATTTKRERTENFNQRNKGTGRGVQRKAVGVRWVLPSGREALFKKRWGKLHVPDFTE